MTFFRDNTPIPRHEALESLAIAYHGIAAAVRTGSLEALSYALEANHRVGFKQRELSQQTASIRNLYSDVVRSSRGRVAVALSSMGPVICAIYDEADVHARKALYDIASANNAAVLADSTARTQGTCISHLR